MSEQKIILNLGGKHRFNVTKTFDGGAERFCVGTGVGRYGESESDIASGATWAEAMNALNAFREEAAEATEALVQISTLTATGQHEDDVPENYVTTK